MIGTVVIATAIAFAPAANGAPGATSASSDKAATQPQNGGALKCGKLLDVRTGKLLSDQVIVFDASGVVTAVGPAGSPLAPGEIGRAS